MSKKDIGKMLNLLDKKTLYEAGMAFELDKHYQNSASVKAAVYGHFQKAKVTPEEYGLTHDRVEILKAIVSNRTLPVAVNHSLREKTDAEDSKTFPELVLSGRVKAMKLLHAKLDRIARSKKQIDDTNLSTLAQTAGILFDKGQILSGEATENVALLAKVESNMSPEAAIEAVLKMRESFQVDKDRTKKKK